MHYPKTPGWKARDTAEAAADATIPHAPALRAQVIAALERHGPMTADEIANVLRLSILSIRPRVSELAVKGKVEDTGLRRANASGKRAIVWRAA
jgi:predicted ArsR family transcriptional regulator